MTRHMFTPGIRVPANFKLTARVLGAMMALLLACGPLFSQANQGTIQGGVFDQSGGVVAGAMVTVTDVARGITRSLVADAAGQYVTPALDPGTYTVRAEAKGFRIEEHRGVLVEVGKNVRVDLTLQPGEQTQTVTVTGEIPAIDTTDATLGGTVTNEAINALPLNGRNFQRLLQLHPGVVTTVGAGAGSSSTNGRRSGDDLILVDGLSTMGQATGGSLINDVYKGGDSASLLPIDAIQEFNEEQNPKAEYGWKEGSVINIGVKSGTNSLHGTAYAFGRDTLATDAGNPFQLPGHTSPSITPATLEQFGATAGGRIIPDKLFWFAGYEGQLATLGDTAVDQIPTSVAGAGAAVSMVDACNALNPTHLANGAMGNPISALSAQLSGLNTATCTVSPASPTNENLWPFLSSTTSDNFAPGLISTIPLNNGLFKGDYVPGPHNRISGLFYISKASQYNNTAAGELEPQWEANVTVANYIYDGDWTWTPNSNWVNEARGGYIYILNNTLNGDQNLLPVNTWPNGYSLNTGVTNPLFGGLPQIAISAFSGFLGVSTRLGRRGPQGNVQITDAVSHLIGKHSLKFGAEYLDIVFGNDTLQPVSGIVKFKTLQTFLQGSPSSESILLGDATINVRSHWFAGFFQDDWRVTPKVTLNLGLRYEVSRPPYERNNYEGNFYPNVDATTTPAIQQFGPGAPEASLYNTDYHGISPRAGVAWDVKGNGRTVARAGFSVLTAPAVMGALEENTPFGANFPSLGINTSGTAVNEHSTIQASKTSGFNWTIAGPVFPTANITNVGGVNYTGITCTAASPCPTGAVDPNFRQPHVLEWNLDIQRAITNTLTVDVAYVANHGFDEETLRDANQPPLGAGFTPAIIQACIVAPSAKNCAPSSAAEIAAEPYNSLFPYLSYITETTNGDFSNYNSLQLTVDKRMSHGLSFLAGYTYAHALDTLNSGIGGGSLVPSTNADLRLNYGTSDNDLRHRFTFSSTYQIPGIRSPAQMLEGWSVGGILVLQDGLPWWPNDATNDLLGTNEFGNSVAGGAAQPWNYTGPSSAFRSGPWGIPCFGNLSGCTAYSSLPPGLPATSVGTAAGPVTVPTECLNAATAPYSGNAQSTGLATAALVNLGCYVQNGGILTPPAYGTVGDAPRNLFRAPNYYNVDFSVAKIWHFKERYSAQFRAEFFNLFNRADFGIPGKTDPNSGFTGPFGCSCSTPDTSNPVLGSGGPRHIQFGLKLGF
jgi:Carboxypeptidase regulatory-like domain